MRLCMCFDKIHCCQDIQYCWQLQCIYSGRVLFPVYNMKGFDAEACGAFDTFIVLLYILNDIDAAMCMMNE